MTDALGAFGWRDALDVLLVSIVVYRILVVFRGSRAAQMLAGLAVLLAASLIAGRLRLPSVQWLLDHFWSFWAIALVVLFQPELRRALARVGQGRVWLTLAGARAAERAQVVEEVVKAVQTLATRRIGALIVLERAAALRPYAELGVPLDALVSADLLESIFLPASPLHDGAVLIQGSRAVAAGCFLPLSRNVQLGRQLGTRHRAALGISEETDAVAIVVSEETGRMAVAVEGRIDTVMDVEMLRRRLQELSEGAPAAGVPVWRRLRIRA